MDKDFRKGFLKCASEATASQRVAAIGVINKGKILLGKRRDNDKWTNPGGHLEGSEKPQTGAQRELLEESGVDISVDKFIALGKGEKMKSNKLTIYPFTVKYKGSVSGSTDPDEEIKQWRWCDMKNMPEDVLKNLHVPKQNVLFDRLGIKY